MSIHSEIAEYWGEFAAYWVRRGAAEKAYQYARYAATAANIAINERESQE